MIQSLVLNMRYIHVVFVAFLCMIVPATAIIAQSYDLNLDFEQVTREGNAPIGWVSSGTHIGFLDENIKKKGVNSVRLEMSDIEDERNFSYYSNRLVIADYIGKEIALRGYIKTENLTGSAGFYLHLQSGTYFKLETVSLDNMQGRRLKGTNDWTQIILRTAFVPNLYQLEFGVYIEGKGKVWVDDLKLLIDNKSYQVAEKRSNGTNQTYIKDVNPSSKYPEPTTTVTKRKAQEIIENRTKANNAQKAKTTNN
jgi:hypothetical protein